MVTDYFLNEWVILYIYKWKWRSKKSREEEVKAVLLFFSPVCVTWVWGVATISKLLHFGNSQCFIKIYSKNHFRP